MESNLPKVLVRPIDRDYHTIISEIFETFGGINSLVKGKVFIKFNGTMQFKSAMTNTELILSIIEYIKEETQAKEIYVMDNSAVGTFSRIVFQVEDFSEKIKKLGAKPLYLDEEKSIDINFDGKVLDKPIAVPKILYKNLILNKEENTYINVPKLKSHVLSEASICIKNQHGLLYDEDKMFKHNLIHEKIVDILNKFKPDLNIVDASSVVNYGPMAIFPSWERPMNLIISGIDPVAVDTVCSNLIGIEYVKHIEMAAQRGFGINNLNEIQVIPSKKLIKKYHIQLDHENVPQKVPSMIKIFKGKEKCCKTGCSFLGFVFMWLANEAEIKPCVGIYGKGHSKKEIDKYDGPFIVNGPCAIEELSDYFEKRQKNENIEVYYIKEHLNIAAVGTAARKAMNIPLPALKGLLPCSFLKLVLLMIWAKLKGGKFVSIR